MFPTKSASNRKGKHGGCVGNNCKQFAAYIRVVLQQYLLWEQFVFMFLAICYLLPPRYKIRNLANEIYR